MEIKDMRAFYAIVEEGNISHAASRLDVAQPALSRQMKRLEGALGVKLFERGSRRIRLTEAGRILKGRVEHILGLVDGTVREIQDVGEGSAGEVRIGTITSSGANLVPGLLAAFHERYKGVTFRVFEAEGARVLELLDNRIIEIAITRTEVENEGYASLVLANEPLAVLLQKEAPCGEAADVVRLEELEDMPVIIPLRWQAVFLAACRKAGFEPDIICLSDSIVQDVLSAKAGLGVAILPLSARSLLTDEKMVCKRLVEPEILTHTVIAWKKDRPLSAAAGNFLAMMQEQLGDIGIA